MKPFEMFIILYIGMGICFVIGYFIGYFFGVRHTTLGIKYECSRIIKCPLNHKESKCKLIKTL